MSAFEYEQQNPYLLLSNELQKYCIEAQGKTQMLTILNEMETSHLSSDISRVFRKNAETISNW